MPTREEIAAWLRRASGDVSPDEINVRKRRLLTQVAQVEAMRCETCANREDDYGYCGELEIRTRNGFGCFSHEQKPAG